MAKLLQVGEVETMFDVNSMSRPDHHLYRRAPWGPLCLVPEPERIRAWVANSAVAEIVAPDAHGFARPETLELLRGGLRVSLNGVPVIVLRQPTRKLARRRDRAIQLEGPSDLVPPGTILRARGFYSMGMETGGARSLVRPRWDVLEAPFLWGFSAAVPRVADDVSLDLLAVWGAASWHLLATVLQ